MGSNLLTSLGLLIGLAAVFGVGIRRLGIPRVAGYLLAGTLLSPSVLGGVLRVEAGAWSEVATTAALGVVAYLIGGSLTVQHLRQQGLVLAALVVGEALGASLVVGVGLTLLRPWLGAGLTPEACIALGAIAATTAPAATLAVMHEYRVRGPMSDLLLGVVGLDDALGILLFAFAVAWLGGHGVGVVQHAAFEIGGAVALGALAGVALAAALSGLRDRDADQAVILASILVVVGTAGQLGASPLLACMTVGFVARAWAAGSGERLLAPIEALEELIFVVFFGIAGMHFDPHVLVSGTRMVLAYIALRAIGKVTGAWLGATVSGAPPVVGRTLGFGLMPQAGVAIGLALRLGHVPALQPMAAPLLNLVLAATLIHELLGPVAARKGFELAGEIGARTEEVFR